MSLEAVDVYVLDSTPQQNPRVGVVVKVFSQDGTQAFTQGTTDTSGHVGFLLNATSPGGTTYQMRMYQFGTSFTQPQYFTVLPDPVPAATPNSFEVIGTVMQPPDANDIRLCAAAGFFRDMTGAPQRGLQIHFIGKFDPLWVDGAAVLKERVIVTSDKRGWAQVNLFRNACYNVTVQGEEDVTREIVVPDQPNVNMADLIFPIVQEVVLDPPPPYSMLVGTSLTIGINVIASNGQELGTAYGDVNYCTTDQGVVGFILNERARTITLQAGSPGTAEIILRRSNRSIVHLPYTPIAGQPLTVVVSAP